MFELNVTGPSATAPGLVLFALALGGFAIGTTEFATMSLLPDFAGDFGIGIAEAGHVISAYALGVVVGAPLLAVLTAGLRRRTLLIALMIAFAVFNALSGLAPNVGWMLVFRFLSGLPHGVYFGIAALTAASLVEESRRTTAVGRMFLGLTIATIIGVPVASLIGQYFGWRWAFALVAALATLTAVLVAVFVPDRDHTGAHSPLAELAALKQPQVWLTLGIGAVGFGGVFAVYTYLTSTLVQVTGASPASIPFALAIFGIGMTAGSLVMPRFADRALMPTVAGLLIWSAIVLAIYPVAAYHLPGIMVVLFCIGFGVALGPVLQTRLMDVAGDAQALAAALNHSAFNTANALGPWLGGLAISAGYGLTSTGWVGVLLAVAGLAIWAVSYSLERIDARRRDLEAAA